MNNNNLLILIVIIFIFFIYYFYKNFYKNKYEKFTNNKKIAFLFLIYDSINQEDIWYHYLKNIDKNKYNIYIHCKYNNIKLKYFEEYKLKNCITTKWGDKSLVVAQNILLEEALKDPSNQHFIFLSNSCIPIKSFNYVYNILDQLVKNI